MSNAAVITISWIAFAVHVAVGIASRRLITSVPLVPWMNLVTAGCVLIYWGQKWYGYATQGVTWYASDQLLPLYALLVCVLALLSVTGRYQGSAVQWLFFVVDAIALLMAALFFSFVRFNRLF